MSNHSCSPKTIIQDSPNITTPPTFSTAQRIASRKYSACVWSHVTPSFPPFSRLANFSGTGEAPATREPVYDHSYPPGYMIDDLASLSGDTKPSALSYSIDLLLITPVGRFLRALRSSCRCLEWVERTVKKNPMRLVIGRGRCLATLTTPAATGIHKDAASEECLGAKARNSSDWRTVARGDGDLM